MTYNTSTLMTLCSPDSRSPRFAENQLAARLLNGEESPPPPGETLTAPADLSARAALCPRGGSRTFDCSIASPATAGAARAAYRRLVAADSAHRRYGMPAAGRCHAHRNGLRTVGLGTRHVGVGMTILPRRRHPKVIAFRGSIPGPHVPLSTLRPRPCERRRMTRGRRGSLATTLPVFAGAQEVQGDTQRTLRARGVRPGEPR